MEPFTSYTALAALLDRQNVDTDQIIPKQFLKKIERTGFGRHLFHDWRWLDDEETRPNPDFVLNQPRYRSAGVLLTRDNFGCGSSREHAPWALLEYGFRSIIAPSIADIFFNNCTKNGMVPVVLKSTEVDELFAEIEANEGYRLTVDLLQQTVSTPTGKSYKFDFPAFAKDCLVRGLDHIGWTLQFAPQIADFEKKYYEERTWLAG
ncbi:MAG TPA: 3-isopropylmalate dehydratase small subunit [Candidatus Glassbacteria bacterium]|nr:3-isopropylmalate dehydratase small subunit [Candidatus Glassbacteria bacterium]